MLHMHSVKLRYAVSTAATFAEYLAFTVCKRKLTQRENRSIATVHHDVTVV
jgi:hypothetical protein